MAERTRGDTTGAGREQDHGRPRGRQARAGLRAGGHVCESGWLGRSTGSPVGSTFGFR
jgi:hypothetical protein